MGYQNLQNTLKAIALTVPAARAFEMTVEFVLGEGQDTATVGRLENHFRDRPAMTACLERMHAEPATRKCIEDRYMGPELNLDELVAYPRGSLGYVYAKVMKLSVTPRTFMATARASTRRPIMSPCACARPMTFITSSPASRCSAQVNWVSSQSLRCSTATRLS